ncbi:hypothetical protein [Tunturibacter empetritectus]|uniref:Uncharacterized protein n=1 Tax=Tunturiibacter empetritectus TaxID=3069691 RepID=A0A7W8IF16_9BACT|nr:hypothetical protein [Edaphobacter lichenicola]MBB5315976.1 hypothetical protein [Edaphobacter lichenicola]
MHIHSSPVSQLTLGSTQSAFQAQEARKAAAAVRRRLSSFAASDGDEVISRVEAQAESNPQRRKNPQQDEEAFRSVFVSVSV